MKEINRNTETREKPSNDNWNSIKLYVVGFSFFFKSQSLFNMETQSLWKKQLNNEIECKMNVTLSNQKK